MRVKCVAQENNTMSLTMARTQTARSGIQCSIIIRPPSFPLLRVEKSNNKIRTNYGKFNIRYNGPILWNETDERFKILTSYAFKRELSMHIINLY